MLIPGLGGSNQTERAPPRQALSECVKACQSAAVGRALPRRPENFSFLRGDFSGMLWAYGQAT